MPQRFIRHDRTQIRAANADVDDVANALPGKSQPLAAADSIREPSHSIEYFMNIQHNVFAIDNDDLIPCRTQRCMQNRPIFGAVDSFTAKHRFDAFGEKALFAKLEQQPQSLGRDSILRVVEIKASRFRSKAIAAVRIFGEELSKVELLY